MKIIVINPNTMAEMTKSITEELDRIRGRDTELKVVNPATGPRAIESAYDESIAAPAVVQIVRAAEADGFDAAVIACFSDPGLDAAREIARIPVIGIGETAYHLAAMLGHIFSIITVMEQRIPHLEDRVVRSGLREKLASIVPLGLTVADTEHRPEVTKVAALEAGQKAVSVHGAEVVILACAGLGRYASELEAALHIPVVSPTAAGLKMAELLVSLHLSHSKIRRYWCPQREIPIPDAMYVGDGMSKKA